MWISRNGVECVGLICYRYSISSFFCMVCDIIGKVSISDVLFKIVI